jgi:hypothetical protein
MLRFKDVATLQEYVKTHPFPKGLLLFDALPTEEEISWLIDTALQSLEVETKPNDDWPETIGED